MKAIIYLIIFIGIIIILSVVLKFRKEKRIKEMFADDKIREENLDKLIMNKQTREKKREENTFAAVPISVNYDANTIEKVNNSVVSKENRKPDNKKIMVQIIENSELSARKYMLNPRKGIYIGNKAGKNHIVINNINIADRQCEIKEISGKVYVKNIGISGKVVLKQGKQSAYVEQKYVEVKNGDALLIENMIYKIELIASNR